MANHLVDSFAITATDEQGKRFRYTFQVCNNALTVTVVKLDDQGNALEPGKQVLAV